jgi:uncharacterized protein with HEPN domain
MWKDDAYLLEMLQAARNASSFLEGRDEASFQADSLLMHAVMMMLVVIGENAHKVSKEFQDAHPEIPWRSMYGTRNVLVHAYGEVNLEKVWGAAHTGVPALIRDLEPLVPPDDGVEPPSRLTPREAS